MSKSNSCIPFQSYEMLLKSFLNHSLIRVDFWNDFVLPENWNFTDRVNDNFHLAYIRKGSGYYLLGDQREEMAEGKIIFVSNGFPHSRILGPNHRPHIFLLRFSVLDNNTLMPLQLPCKPFAFAHTPADHVNFYRLFNMTKDVLKNNSSKEFPCPQICSAMLSQILLTLYESLAPKKLTAADDPRITDTIKYMTDNINKNISLHDLTVRSGLSRNYFRHLFKAQCGLNPKEYFMQLKLRHACELLCETDCKIQNIAADLGYSDQYAFSKQFKEHMGISPSKLRNNR